jgi:hypothetical protein
MRSLRLTTFALAALVGPSMLIGQASAMPANGLAPAAKQITDGVQDVRWVCGPYRCWWRPGPYWGWGGGWHRWGWRRWGWRHRW